MSIIIKTLKNSDSKDIIDIILPIQQLEFGVPITLADQPDLLDIENFYILKGGNFWGANVEGTLCGTIALLRFNNKAAAIRKMFVKKEFRGKEYGIASSLLAELIRYCKENGIENLYLGTVDILKAAIRFYEKKGFVQLDKKEMPFDFPFMTPDNIFCHLAL
ncbi:GNAT family N-acetyltransferase [Pedobacter jamesrossensis]|uniref:GNAT family N-acetyltransferase n=1 Tax=Pedobacter jamesrossensis TaxID=1908238 RepID=A0ABV8NJD2_9SPHI